MQLNIDLKLSLCILLSFHFTNCEYNVNYMELGSEVKNSAKNDGGLQIYCYRGRTKQVLYIWQTVSLKIKIANDNFEQYEGYTPTNVTEEYLERRSSWSLGLFNNKKTVYHLNPFNQTCIGIDSQESYSIHLNYLRVDFWKLVMLVAGLTLFHGASKLSNNTFFYYGSGITVGICASFLILVYLISRMIPKKPAMYGFMVGGWTLAVYFLQILCDNLRTVLLTYKTYVLWYIVISGVVSFLVCYRMGPIQDRKSKNIIKWTMQCIGLFLIAMHTDYQEAAVAICCIVVLSKYFPKSIAERSQKLWRSRFPPKPILLTSEEYYAQGVVETCKALQELRQHCSSPECKQWNTILKLKNVKRFASFVEGSSHLTDQEILDHDSEEAIAYTKTNADDPFSNYRRNGQVNMTDDEEDRISEDSSDES